MCQPGLMPSAAVPLPRGGSSLRPPQPALWALGHSLQAWLWGEGMGRAELQESGSSPGIPWIPWGIGIGPGNSSSWRDRLSYSYQAIRHTDILNKRWLVLYGCCLFLSLGFSILVCEMSRWDLGSLGSFPTLPFCSLGTWPREPGLTAGPSQPPGLKGSSKLLRTFGGPGKALGLYCAQEPPLV